MWSFLSFLLCLGAMPAVINCLIVLISTKFFKGKPDEFYSEETSKNWFYNKWIQLGSFICLFLLFFISVLLTVEAERKLEPQEFIKVQEELYYKK